MWKCENCGWSPDNLWDTAYVRCFYCSGEMVRADRVVIKKTFIKKLKEEALSLKRTIKVEQRLIPIYQYLIEELYNNHKIDVIEDLNFHQKRHVMMLFSRVATEQEINQCSCDAEFSRNFVNLVSRSDERLKHDTETAAEVLFEIQQELIEMFWVAQKDIFEYIFSQARNDKIDFENGAKK